jgi:hypothetical protein
LQINARSANINRFVSSEQLIRCDVPQGSILGPLMFLLYINDLPECLNNTRPRLFADDTNLTASGKSIADIELAVNSDLHSLRNWLIANKLSLDVAKTEFMLIGAPQMIRNYSNFQPNILIVNKQIRQVNKTKTLGTTIDQQLTWKTNTVNICKKNNIRNFSSTSCVEQFIADRNTLISIYNAIVRPYFDYCSDVWDVFGETQSKRLQKLQNRAARIISNFSNYVDNLLL